MLRLRQSIRIDGSIFLARDERILWSYHVPAWVSRWYVVIVEWCES